ncbi:putative membrane protein [Halalkaliarchaeum sp. AArc-CO]|uniref:hypothetical protein n=1 Tax=unclassified Halalkaliarchaeum TaxID=2678344 RepID=UPI00217DB426|nr:MULTISPECIES: hypothetical protein [unclassified Halalkaliarchaeum]MDR5673978.1 hypothetical protein [Halalkaliarchaeum sp. AArc-GB]UWG50614.1 putative membrane protein [Halalkaliarchaeum sp. AArc-CO]
MDPLVVESLPTIRSLLYYGAVYGILVAVAYWVYTDARARGSRYAVLWGLATLVFAILAVIPYMYLRWRDGTEAAA